MNRRQRRFFERKTPNGKNMLKSNFLSQDNTEKRQLNLQDGIRRQNELIDKLSESNYEKHAPIEAEIENLLKSVENITQEEIDSYLEIWSDTVMWPKSKTHHSSRKSLLKLTKKYFGVGHLDNLIKGNRENG